MEMMTVRQLAEKHNVTYESMRKLLSKHAEALKGHIVTQDRTRYLDEWAIQFLEEERKKSKIVVIREDHTDEIARLSEEVEKLKAQLVAAQAELLTAQQARISALDRIVELQETERAALTMKEDLEKQKQETESLREQQKENDYVISKLMQERNEARAEADSYQKSWFGFYRKKP